MNWNERKIKFRAPCGHVQKIKESIHKQFQDTGKMPEWWGCYLCKRAVKKIKRNKERAIEDAEYKRNLDLESGKTLYPRRQKRRDYFLKGQGYLRNLVKSFPRLNKQSLYWSMVNYDPIDLREHFSSCFEFWSFFDFDMDKNAYGVLWEIDHRKPQSHSDFLNRRISDEDAFRECFDLKNVRPTPVIYNRSKASLYEGKYHKWNGKFRKRHENISKRQEQLVVAIEQIYDSYLEEPFAVDEEYQRIIAAYFKTF